MLFASPSRNEPPRPWSWQGIAIVWTLIGFAFGFVVARMLRG